MFTETKFVSSNIASVTVFIGDDIVDDYRESWFK